jgi:hypothetical protein
MNKNEIVASFRETPEFQQAVAARLAGEDAADDVAGLGTSLLAIEAQKAAMEAVDEEVAYQQMRRDLHADGDEYAAREKKWNAAREATEAKRREYAAIMESYERDIAALAETEQVALHSLSRASNAQARLRETYRGPLRAQLAEAVADGARLLTARNEANEVLGRLKNNQFIAPLAGTTADAMRRIEARIAETTKQIADLDAAIAANKSDQQRIDRDMRRA